MAKKRTSEPAPQPSTSRGELRHVKLSELVPDPRNPKEHDEVNRVAVRESLLKHQQVQPVVVQNGTLRIIAGNCCVEEMLGLGWTETDVYVIECSDEEAAELSVTLNRTGELGKWNRTTLREIFGELTAKGDGKVPGWTQEELAKILGVKDAPDEFPEIGEDLATEHKCPKCGYKWSGKAETGARETAQ